MKLTSYEIAGKILEKLYKKQGTIKSLIMNEKSAVDKKFLYALVCETLKYREVIEVIIEKSDIAKQEKIPKPLLAALIYDLLFGKGLKNAGKYKEKILKHKTRLNAELVKIKIKRKCKSNEELIPDHIRNAIVIPRYVRVNTHKTTLEEALNHFQELGYNLSDKDYTKIEIGPNMMFVDPHIPNLLVLPPNSDLHLDEFLKEGKIILQDKASCFPAYILNPPKGSVVIDGCAAPGNKTSHLAAIMQNSGRIFAFDKDKIRLKTLEKLTGVAGCDNIQPIHGSFLDSSPKDKNFKDVEYILLDPSCSGSGIVGRLDHLTKDIMEEEAGDDSQDRISSLAEFQISVILHAFTFPKVKRVVYSTCSKYEAENEMVVKKVLEKSKEFRLHKGTFPAWDCRGNQVIKDAKDVIRTDPAIHKTIGFFVALFERVN